jgi:hypothetical protein
MESTQTQATTNPGMMAQPVYGGMPAIQSNSPSGDAMPQLPHQMAARPPVPKGKDVEVPKIPEKKTTWKDISEYQNIYDWLFITVGVIIVEALVICLVRFFPDIFGKSINVWYNRFKLSAVITDVLIMMIGIGITRYIYSEYVYPDYDWSPIYFTVLAVIVQFVHDVLFYLGPIRSVPRGQNAMMDVFKEYAETAGYKSIGADSMMVIGTSICAMLLKSAPVHVTFFIGLVTSYAIPYLLETKNEYSNIS